MNDLEKIPFVVYESAQARSERTIKRLILALIIVTAMLFVSNIIWVYEWTQYDYVSSQDIDIDGKDGIANYIGANGSIVNGEDNRP